MAYNLLLQRNIRTGELLALQPSSIPQTKLFQLLVSIPASSLILNHGSNNYAININCFNESGVAVSPNITYFNDYVVLEFQQQFAGIINLLYESISVPKLSANLPEAKEGEQYYGELYGLSGFTPYTFFASNLPNGLTIDSSTGIISGTPTNGTAGQINIECTITDFYGSSYTQTFMLSIEQGLYGRITKDGFIRITKAGNPRITKAQ